MPESARRLRLMKLPRRSLCPRSALQRVAQPRCRETQDPYLGRKRCGRSDAQNNGQKREADIDLSRVSSVAVINHVWLSSRRAPAPTGAQRTPIKGKASTRASTRIRRH